MSTGLYLLEGQSAEVSLSEAAATAGLKVRQTLGISTIPNIAKTLPHHIVIYISPTLTRRTPGEGSSAPFIEGTAETTSY